MTTARASMTINTIAVGIIMISAVFGNVPLLARQADVSGPRVVAVEAASAADHTVAVQPTELDASGEPQLIPALYAWDPDVRFVFFHHISKWM